MLDTFLFDLDGTLLPLDIDKFMDLYFHEMGKAFYDMIKPKELVQHIWTATGAMVNNNGSMTNEEAFMENFGQLVDGDIEIYKKRFDAFYDKGFLKSKEATEKIPVIRESIKLLKDKGYELVIATNPIFPYKAIMHRIEWAGLDPEDFIYISSFERNNYCKPNILFYKEILKAISKSPSQCIMVGNDVQEDLIASQLGMETFLITDYMIHRNEDEISCTYKGSYSDFYKFSGELKKIK